MADAEKRAVAVPVATVWDSPGAVREIDRPAVAETPDAQAWADTMTREQKLDLMGRVHTQLLLGEPVVVLEESADHPDWVRIAAPRQPSDKDDRGYPGWVLRAHLERGGLDRDHRLVRRHRRRCPEVGAEHPAGVAAVVLVGGLAGCSDPDPLGVVRRFLEHHDGFPEQQLSVDTAHQIELLLAGHRVRPGLGIGCLGHGRPVDLPYGTGGVPHGRDRYRDSSLLCIRHGEHRTGRSVWLDRSPSRPARVGDRRHVRQPVDPEARGIREDHVGAVVPQAAADR
ncbi:MAG TPA: SH3 domain-containing protein [Actinopolymorphaceae bacterium]